MVEFKKIVAILLFLFSAFFFAIPCLAQKKVLFEETLETRVVKVLVEKKENDQLYQKLELFIVKGSLKNEKIIIESGGLPLVSQQKYRVGDRLLVMYTKDSNGQDVFYISDYLRRPPLALLFLIFVVLAVVVSGWRGASSLLGLAASFLVIFKFILPQIIGGSDPILVSIVGCLLIIPISFFLAHGVNQKTVVAIGGTMVALIITGILAKFFVVATHLTGFASEEAGLLQVAREGAVNFKGLLLAGIIIGAVGVLDDVTISQAAIVFELKSAARKLSFGQLYRRAMNVGQDHVSSMINTLVLVYAGSVLPLLLLFVNNPHPFLEVINYEIIAEEVVRTLVGSIGLISAVPITTVLAALIVTKVKN